MTNILFLTFLLLVPYVGALVLNRLRTTEVVSFGFAARLGLALVMFTTGITHFAQTDGMRMLLPAWVPGAGELILVTGVLEIAAGVGLLVEPTARFTAHGLIFFFIAIFPANVWAAFNHVDYGGHSLSPAYPLLRGPLQALLIFWSWRIARGSHSLSSTAGEFGQMSDICRE